jgi:hypothetical protein
MPGDNLLGYPLVEPRPGEHRLQKVDLADLDLPHARPCF